MVFRSSCQLRIKRKHPGRKNMRLESWILDLRSALGAPLRRLASKPRSFTTVTALLLLRTGHYFKATTHLIHRQRFGTWEMASRLHARIQMFGSHPAVLCVGSQVCTPNVFPPQKLTHCPVYRGRTFLSSLRGRHMTSISLSMCASAMLRLLYGSEDWWGSLIQFLENNQTV